jgi:alkylation response protein AidB-like acyl-CoA dehydrogenase
MVNADGSLGARNDAYCVSIEHKLGIHASPTCVMAFGDNGGAVGYLVGEENRGLEYMFIMMNEARFGVGLEGRCACERAYQRARDYAARPHPVHRHRRDAAARRWRSSTTPTCAAC